jgi:hypothetical protein
MTMAMPSRNWIRYCMVRVDQWSGAASLHERWTAVTPFARLSQASAQYQIEDAVARFAGDCKKDPARSREEAEPEGSPAAASRRPILSTSDVPAAARERRSPPTDALSPPPNRRLRRSACLGGSQFSRPNRQASSRVRHLSDPLPRLPQMDFGAISPASALPYRRRCASPSCAPQ